MINSTGVFVALTEFVVSRPAAGGESCIAGFYFFRFAASLYRKLKYNENRTFQEKSKEQTFLFTGGERISEAIIRNNSYF